MDSSPLKNNNNNRKVRFFLPEGNIPSFVSTGAGQQKLRLTHGTMQYVNGTLVGQTTNGGESQSSTSAPVKPTPTVGKPKDPSNKIVLHLRPSTGFERHDPMEMTMKPVASAPGVEKITKVQRKLSKSGIPRMESRSFKMLPSINQKEDLNNNSVTRETSAGYPRNTDTNNNVSAVKKQTVVLRSITNNTPLASNNNSINNVSAKPLSVRMRSKSVGKVNQSKGSKTLISPHLQNQEVGISIKVQGSSTSRRSHSSGSEIVELTGTAFRLLSDASNGTGDFPTNNARQKSQYAKCNFLTVPEFSDRYEGMETVISASTAINDEEEEVGEEHLLTRPNHDKEPEGQERAPQRPVVVTENRTNGVEGPSVETAAKNGGSVIARGGKLTNGLTNGTSSAASERDAYLQQANPARYDDSGFKCIQDTNLGRDRNSLQFWDFVERWRANRALKKLSDSPAVAQLLKNDDGGASITTGSGSHHRPRGGSGTGNLLNCSSSGSDPAVQSGDSDRSDVKSPTLSSRIRALRMSMEQVPTVTTLLRASRDANEYLLKEVFRDILENGISRENLNSTDRSGRTAISYICSTNLTNFLELFLQLPGIDVNKPDNEGNTPLHFAAQAGLSDIVNMLITKCRSLVVDPKNNLGFTPLMKAALQGRTRCAKLLLFAGASPVETDSGRGFRAEQWARFCGRHTCAETIEQCARARLLDKSAPCGKWSHDINLPIEKNASLKATRSGSLAAPSTNQNGLRSKFRKVFPFSFNSSKDKQVSKELAEEHYTKDLVNYLKSATICVSGPALSANRKIIQSLIRPLEVPKLEVTYAHNNALIKKYESTSASSTSSSASGASSTDSAAGKPPAVASDDLPRGDSNNDHPVPPVPTGSYGGMVNI
ncbi:uncharacterized protein LOC129757967 isoform X2 [Uranotaenia lowii]|uniref:uncharacterized protein LOC129757967 isoform X2 n=1 Tax=Uranotaenia lowii TaxID=190385 RepID=UPI00247A45CD|nr:uncharacterized protein LOC129757967 isoform X2 [Uranotaenia lowii]